MFVEKERTSHQLWEEAQHAINAEISKNPDWRVRDMPRKEPMPPPTNNNNANNSGRPKNKGLENSPRRMDQGIMSHWF